MTEHRVLIPHQTFAELMPVAEQENKEISELVNFFVRPSSHHCRYWCRHHYGAQGVSGASGSTSCRQWVLA